MDWYDYKRREWGASWNKQFEEFRFYFQTKASLDAAALKLQESGLDRFKDFDRRRAATFQEIGIEFSTKAKGTDVFDRHVEKNLSAMPPFITKMLAEFDTAIWTGKTAKDIDEDVAREKARGASGKTIEEGALGFFSSRTRIIAALRDKLSLDGKEPTEARVGFLLRHEIGHAVDNYLGLISQTPAFRAEYRKSYEAERQAMIASGMQYARENGFNPAKIDSVSDSDLAEKYGFGDSTVIPSHFRALLKGNVRFFKSYYHEESQGGTHKNEGDACSEAFAELVQEWLYKRTHPQKLSGVEEREGISAQMPEAAKFVDKLMTDLERYYTFAPKPLVPH